MSLIQELRRRWWLVVAGLVVLLLLFATQVATFYTDVLWFDSVGFVHVFWTILGTRIGIGVVGALVAAALIVGNLLLAKRLAPAYRIPSAQEETVERYRELVEPFTRPLLLAVGALVSRVEDLQAAVAPLTWTITLCALTAPVVAQAPEHVVENLKLEGKAREIEAKQREIEALMNACGELERTRAEKDRIFQEESKKAVDKRMRMNRIKNAKELQALQREIDQSKQVNGDLEEEILKLMQEIDGLRTQIKSKEDEALGLKAEWQQKQEALLGQISGIDTAVSEAALRRQSIASQLANDLISRYELIFSRRGGTAVVEVSGGICQGCYMNIPPQLGNEIIKNEKLHLCPSCQRILYVKPSDGQVEKTA